ncbi:hypothetical protein [Oscillibacter sp.]|nr:hypothetical protein [Oscillibacter sp.]MDD3346925.1 hypothetical protein [Oscillibacter sp.]
MHNEEKILQLLEQQGKVLEDEMLFMKSVIKATQAIKTVCTHG